MMMPFLLEDTGTVPWLPWGRVVRDLLKRTGADRGVGYLTLDEAIVPAGECHRRPGLHVDGARGATWGPAPTPYGYNGMILVASHYGCDAYPGEYEGEPGDGGSCEHMRAQTVGRERVEMAPERAYWCGHHAIHESLPMPVETPRQLLRLSMPSNGVWFENYTPSPFGIQPTGPILPAREEMSYRP